MLLMLNSLRLGLTTKRFQSPRQLIEQTKVEEN